MPISLDNIEDEYIVLDGAVVTTVLLIYGSYGLLPISSLTLARGFVLITDGLPYVVNDGTVESVRLSAILLFLSNGLILSVVDDEMVLVILYVPISSGTDALDEQKTLEELVFVEPKLLTCGWIIGFVLLITCCCSYLKTLFDDVVDVVDDGVGDEPTDANEPVSLTVLPRFLFANSYMSPNIPAKVLRKFFIVSSASSTTDVWLCGGPGRVG